MKLLLTTYGLISLLCQLSQAQNRVDACFTINKTTVCVGEKVIARNCIIPSGNTAGVGLFNFGDTDVPIEEFVSAYPVPTGEDTNHTYNKPGVYRIKQKGGLRSGGGIDDTIIYVTVLENRKPQLTIGLCEGNVANFSPDPYYPTYTFVPESGAPAMVISSAAPYKHTYTSGTLKTASITSPCGQTTSLELTPFVTLQPPDVLSLQVGDSTSLIMNALSNHEYKIIEITGAGIKRVTDTVKAVQGVTRITRATSTTQQCFQVVSFDDCGKQDSSKPICKHQLTVQAQDNQNLVSWTQPSINAADISFYRIYRNGIVIDTALTSEVSFVDVNVSCGKSYLYTLQAQMNYSSAANLPILSVSTAPAVTARSATKPQVLTNLQSTINGNTVELTWPAPAAAVKAYSIQRSLNYQPYAPLTPAVTTSAAQYKFTDDKVSLPGNKYCYKISYQDSCLNQAPESVEVCPVVLNVSQNDNTNLNVWSAYYDGNTGHIYTLEILGEGGDVINTFPVSRDTLYAHRLENNDESVLRYRVRVNVNGRAGNISYSNIVLPKSDMVFYLPDAFTPNNDDVNEAFKVTGKYFKDFHLKIYNRWGELLFISTSLDQSWNGTFQGTPAPVDTYVYILEATNKSGQQVVKKGSILLLR